MTIFIVFNASFAKEVIFSKGDNYNYRIVTDQGRTQILTDFDNDNIPDMATLISQEGVLRLVRQNGKLITYFTKSFAKYEVQMKITEVGSNVEQEAWIAPILQHNSETDSDEVYNLVKPSHAKAEDECKPSAGFFKNKINFQEIETEARADYFADILADNTCSKVTWSNADEIILDKKNQQCFKEKMGSSNPQFYEPFTIIENINVIKPPNPKKIICSDEKDGQSYTDKSTGTIYLKRTKSNTHIAQDLFHETCHVVGILDCDTNKAFQTAVSTCLVDPARRRSSLQLADVGNKLTADAAKEPVKVNLAGYSASKYVSPTSLGSGYIGQGIVPGLPSLAAFLGGKVNAAYVGPAPTLASNAAKRTPAGQEDNKKSKDELLFGKGDPVKIQGTTGFKLIPAGANNEGSLNAKAQANSSAGTAVTAVSGASSDSAKSSDGKAEKLSSQTPKIENPSRGIASQSPAEQKILSQVRNDLSRVNFNQASIKALKTKYDKELSKYGLRIDYKNEILGSRTATDTYIFIDGNLYRK